MGLKQIGIVVTLILCCALVVSGTAATIDISQKRLYAGKKITVINDRIADPVFLHAEFFVSDAGSNVGYDNLVK